MSVLLSLWVGIGVLPRFGEVEMETPFQFVPLLLAGSLFVSLLGDLFRFYACKWISDSRRWVYFAVRVILILLEADFLFRGIFWLLAPVLVSGQWLGV